MFLTKIKEARLREKQKNSKEYKLENSVQCVHACKVSPMQWMRGLIIVVGSRWNYTYPSFHVLDHDRFSME